MAPTSSFKPMKKKIIGASHFLLTKILLLMIRTFQSLLFFSFLLACLLEVVFFSFYSNQSIFYPVGKKNFPIKDTHKHWIVRVPHWTNQTSRTPLMTSRVRLSSLLKLCRSLIRFGPEWALTFMLLFTFYERLEREWPRSQSPTHSQREDSFSFVFSAQKLSVCVVFNKKHNSAPAPLRCIIIYWIL